MEEEDGQISIKSWAEEDRPREKLLRHGRNSVSDAELIAILIGSGSRTESAVQLSQRMLKECSQNLMELGKWSVHDFTRRFKGIGDAKAISIMAALELGRRRNLANALERKKINGSKDAATIFMSLMDGKTHEEFWVMVLNRANFLMGTFCISKGGMTGTVADGKEIFRTALEQKAVSILLSHNHPSGNLKPSEADIRLTKKLRDAGNALDIPVLDHIIVSDSGYYSFADESNF